MKILVTTASKHGSTAEIGDRIGEVLTVRGHDVEVKPPEGVDVAGFDAVIVGSAVYAGHWMASAKGLIERAGDELSARPTWLFSSGPIGDLPTPDEDPVDVAPIMEATKAKGHQVFAGKIDRGKLTFPERAIVSALRVPSGDFREWSEIEGWASHIADTLGTGS